MASIGGWLLIGAGLAISLALVGLGLWGAWFWVRELTGGQGPDEPT